MNTSYGETKGLLGGLLLTVIATLLLLVGVWQLTTVLAERPLILLVASIIGLLAIFIAIGVALGRAQRAGRVQETQGTVGTQETVVVVEGNVGDQATGEVVPGHADQLTHATAGGATLSVLKFDDPYGADRVLVALQGLQERHMITLEDAAVVNWPQGNKKPTTRPLQSTAATGTLNAAFWGFLFGLIFFVPFLGAAIGARMGALTSSMADVGIDDDFIKEARKRVTEGTSALFVMMRGERVTEKVAGELKGYEFTIISTKLPEQQDRQLHEAFADE